MEFDLDGDGAAHVIPFLIKHNYVKERDRKVKRQLFFVIISKITNSLET